MGRPYKTENEKKIKIAISIDRGLYQKIKESGDKTSRIIEKIVREYYERENLRKM
jgi:hypothetical protein